ncbi:hypothetical protein [Desulfolutivibrio sulfoxidireducens]|uniref:hypothetical protein n=1 Tax=Desulfolutivibrio sulfoxidireducens TaxID=2773299 RepID=UPI00159D1624|nr:hypothetical protein [Desulfolutivibrio sulfoxidireducens]QLA20993.1 hypothetical protein GD604_15330 [Desulfolutivibrio sulfoxidireducens]
MDNLPCDFWLSYPKNRFGATPVRPEVAWEGLRRDDDFFPRRARDSRLAKCGAWLARAENPHVWPIFIPGEGLAEDTDAAMRRQPGRDGMPPPARMRAAQAAKERR